MTNPPRDDRIYPITRWVLIAMILVLLCAFAVLYRNPGTTKANFAWEIKPQITAVFKGAVNFIDPLLLIAVWLWKLTPLSTRVRAWGTLVSVGRLVPLRSRNTWKAAWQTSLLTT